MTFIADLHIHSHFSRATARNLDPYHLAFWGKKKGITLIGTGDLTHPGWVGELQEHLIPAERGLFKLRPELEKQVETELPESCRRATRFLLSGEISCIYKRAGKTRKVHHLILMPDFKAVEKLNRRLDRIGNITSDGRPILGLDSRDLLEITLEATDRAFFIPAHIWTPWFSLFGSKSGFDAIEGCFGDLTSHIHALETGLSSDPPMNRLLSALDGYVLVSNSDAHSPAKLGREANLFNSPLDYDPICEAMRTGRGFGGTIEFYPEEGKYHMDGHRKCQVRLEPSETMALQGICPSCGKPLTVGVLHRVMALADREQPKLTKPFHSLIPLTEILSEILECGPSTKKVLSAYEDILAALGPELHILMEAPLKELEKAGGPILATALERMRRDKVIREGGYDGEFGVIRVFDPAERDHLMGQTSLFGPLKKNEKNDPKKRFIPEKRPAGEKKEPVPVPGEKPGDPILDPLNDEQKKAVLEEHTHLLIVAGPGTGKTMTLTHRIAHLIRSGLARPGRILALTFTNKAAQEMDERILSLVSALSPDGFMVRTFHGFCLDVLRKHGERLGLPPDFDICPEQDVPELLHQVSEDSGKGKRVVQRCLRNLSKLKTASLLPETEMQPDADFTDIFEQYQHRLRSLGMLDLDDLEVETCRLFRSFPDVARAYGETYPWIFVDEYQDTAPLQTEILKALVNDNGCNSEEDPKTLVSIEPPTKEDKGSAKKSIKAKPYTSNLIPQTAFLCAIGDPDQAIYGFRGADVRNFHRFEEDFRSAKKNVLTRNYRSTQTILDAASALREEGSPLKGVGGKGQDIAVASCRSSAEEAEMIVEQVERLMGGTTYFSLDSGRVASHEEAADLSFGDIAVLYRLNMQGDVIEEAFSRAGIPCMRSGEKPLTARYPVNPLWRFLIALNHKDNPFYRMSYIESVSEFNLDGEALLEKTDPDASLVQMIDQAIEWHHLDNVSEAEMQDLRKFRDAALNVKGGLGAFKDLLSLQRGIDHDALFGDRTALMSLHAAKGLEWPVVFITGCEDGLLPCALFGERDDEEEKRLFYVGITRARQRLILSHAAHRTVNGRALRMKPSPFLDLLPTDLCVPLERSHWKPKKKAHEQLPLFHRA